MNLGTFFKTYIKGELPWENYRRKSGRTYPESARSMNFPNPSLLHKSPTGLQLNAYASLTLPAHRGSTIMMRLLKSAYI